MLISEIEPIDKFGCNFLEKNNPDDLINELIELPLREACRIFLKKGIQTVMSSANKNNVLKSGETPKEKADVKGKHLFWPSPTFEDAGRGYTWIMLNFNTLSDENKDWLFSLEERKGNNGENIGEKAIWFVRSSTYDFHKLTKNMACMFTEKEIIENTEIDERLSIFEKKSFVLSYNDAYPSSTVFIRMPVNEQTTVEEVEKYFVKFAESFKTQEQEKEAKTSSVHADREDME